MAKNFGQPWNKWPVTEYRDYYLVEFETRDFYRPQNTYYKENNVYLVQAKVRPLDLRYYLDSGIKVNVLKTPT